MSLLSINILHLIFFQLITIYFMKVENMKRHISVAEMLVLHMYYIWFNTRWIQLMLYIVYITLCILNQRDAIVKHYVRL